MVSAWHSGLGSHDPPRPSPFTTSSGVEQLKSGFQAEQADQQVTQQPAQAAAAAGRANPLAGVELGDGSLMFADPAAAWASVRQETSDGDVVFHFH